MRKKRIKKKRIKKPKRARVRSRKKAAKAAAEKKRAARVEIPKLISPPAGKEAKKRPKEISDLIALGKEKGHLTFEEVNNLSEATFHLL